MFAAVLGFAAFFWAPSTIANDIKMNSLASAATSANGSFMGTIVWSNCTVPVALPGTDCGNATVPLDYSNPSAGVAHIALARHKAPGVRKGVVWLAQGGPGLLGRTLVTDSASIYRDLLGNDYDLIALDTRGIGASWPIITCMGTAENAAAFAENTRLYRGYDIGPNLTDLANKEQLVRTQREIDALYETSMELCMKNAGDFPRYMGTADVVRDINLMNTILDGEDALINYYGVSYSTVIGQFIFGMYPEKVGRLIIDGVVDATDWTQEPAYQWNSKWLVDTEKTYRELFEFCVRAGPDNCPLMEDKNDSVDNILRRVEDFVQSLYDKPLAAPNSTNPNILTFGRMRHFLYRLIAEPIFWDRSAPLIVAAMSGDAGPILDQISVPEVADLSRTAVVCNDNKGYGPLDPEVVVDVTLAVTANTTRFAFPQLIGGPWGFQGCQFWPYKVPQPFLGPFNTTTKNPILIISNTADPVTPLLNGQRVHERLGNSSSALLVVDAPGHLAIGRTSPCMRNVTLAYFANGTLPSPGTVCPIEDTFFGPQNNTKVSN